MFVESDSYARVRTSDNVLGWFLVYLNQETGEPYILKFEKWVAVEGLAGFEGFEPVKTKVRTLYDTATNELIGVI
jgi:hypothetical protein